MDRITRERLLEIAFEHGRTSGEYMRAISAYQKQLKADGELDSGGKVRQPKPEQRVVLPMTKAEIDRQIHLALEERDYERLRELALRKVALQLSSNDPKIVRDAAGKILNEIELETDDQVRLVQYITPAAPGWEDLPPADFYLPDSDASEVTTASD